MTPHEAAAHIGDPVIYRPLHRRDETGVIIRVTERGVFVRYGTDEHAKLTRPSDLRLLDTRAVFQEPPR